jgi:hypothetical protein
MFVPPVTVAVIVRELYFEYSCVDIPKYFRSGDIPIVPPT